MTPPDPTPHDPEREFARSNASVFTVVAVLALIHLARQFVDQLADMRILSEFAFVPAQFTLPFDREAVFRAAARAVADRELTTGDVAFLLGGGLRWWSPLTYALLHGSFAHLAVNSVWLLAFGAAVARRFGPPRFLALLAFTAIAGAATFYALHPLGFAPVIGASAAVSGAMGAAVRFAFAPGAPLGGGYIGERNLQAYRQPAPSLRDVLRERRAMTFLALWFALNFVFGAVAPIGADGPVAWEAHVGGFLAGFFGFALLDPTLDAPPAESR